jgi:tol-pal system protein YbgF
MNTTTRFMGTVLVAGLLTSGLNVHAQSAQRSIEQRVGIIEQQLRSQALINMLQEVRTLRREVNTLRGDNEVLNNRIGKLTQQVRDLSTDTERRLQRIATGAPGTGSSAVSPAPAATQDTGTTGTTNVGAASSADAQADYQAAVDKLMAGDYNKAVGAFEGFLTNHGDSQYAGNAMYWLAETYYQQERSDQALAAYDNLVATHPDHTKVPEASLKSAFILDEQGKRGEAIAALQAILRDYPGASVENLARQRLANIQNQ